LIGQTNCELTAEISGAV